MSEAPTSTNYPGPYEQIDSHSEHLDSETVVQPSIDPYANQGFVAAPGAVIGIPVVPSQAIPPMAYPVAYPVQGGQGGGQGQIVVQGQNVVMQRTVCCGCSKSCCAVYLNVVLALMLTLSWIGCCVMFGGTLHLVEVRWLDGSGSSLSTPPAITSYSSSYKQSSFVDFDGKSKDYSSVDAVSSCLDNGHAITGLYAFTFIIITVHLIMLVLRIIPKIQPQNMRKYATYEVVGVSVALLFYLIGVIVWSQCVNKSVSYAETIYPTTNYTVTSLATGYFYGIFCFVLMIACLVHSITIRNDPFYTVMGRVHLLNNAGVPYGGGAPYGAGP